MSRFLWICLGGAVGSGLRYLVAVFAANRLSAGFPYGTLIVNLLGCFIIAGVMQAALQFAWSPTLRMAIAVGFVGGLTTYSSFNYETMTLIANGASMAALSNVMLTLVGGVASGWLGLMTAKWVFGG